MLRIVKRNFIYLTPDSFVVLYKAMIRSHLEYAVSVWNHRHQSLIEKLEKSSKTGYQISYKCLKNTLRRKVTTTEDTYFEIQKDKRRYDRICIIKIYYAGKYDNNTTEWITGKCIEKQHDTRNHLHHNSHTFIVICVHLIFQIGLSQYGIVYQIMLLLLIPIHLKHVLINSGRTKMFDTIGKSGFPTVSKSQYIVYRKS